MKKKKVILFSIIVLIIVSVFIIFSYSSGTYNEKIKNFAVEDTSKVTKIFLANKDNNTVLLEREQSGKWRLNGTYEALQPFVDLFLETIQRIKVKNPVPQKSNDFIFKRMSSNSVKCEIYEQCYRIDFMGIKFFPHEKMTRCYYVGDPTQDNLGTFMLMEGSDIPFVVYLPGFRGYVSGRYRADEKDWRSRKLLNYNASDIQHVSLEYLESPDCSFSIDIDQSGKINFNTSESNQPKSVDTLKIINYLNSFKNINIESFVSYNMDSLRIDSIIHTSPTKILTLTPYNGETITLQIYPLRPPLNPIDETTGLPQESLDRFYIYTKGDFLLAQYFVFDKILRKREYFVIK